MDMFVPADGGRCLISSGDFGTSPSWRQLSGGFDPACVRSGRNGGCVRSNSKRNVAADGHFACLKFLAVAIRQPVLLYKSAH
jgi:hypothetical protein